MHELSDFPGFGPAAFDWLDQLAADNSRAFFTATSDVYETALRDPLAALLRGAADEHGGTPRVFRQLRDLRFATNREHPYWPSVAGEVAGRPSSGSALVLDISVHGLSAMAGYRRPFTRDQLARYRAAVDEPTSGTGLAGIVAELRASALTVHGATLRTVPRGIPREHPRAELLRHTSLYGAAMLQPTVRRRRRRADERSIDPAAAQEHLELAWTRLGALTEWLDRYVGPADAPVPDALAASAA